MSDQRLVRPAPISGFPEWLPEVRMVEQRWLDRIRDVFERYGFCSVETPSVEVLDVLMSKGDTSNEVYTLHRVQNDGGASEARLGMHFDLTVPFARYVAQHFNSLTFPFKRYQIQRVWRGERPQEGRFREFTQCDIDVINVDQIPRHFDAELPRIIHEILTELELPAWTININNRKVLQGFYEGLGISDPLAVIRIADKIDKIGADGVAGLLTSELSLEPRQVSACLDLAQIRGTDASVVDEIRKLGVTSPLLDEGLDELSFVMDELSDLPSGSVVADLSIARGLDYYTGTVYEGKFVDWPNYGSICSGGRYEDLAGSFIRRNLPGIGMSIGLTRIFAKLVAEGIVKPGPSSPSQVLVAVPDETRYALARATAAQLRSRGINTELYHQADKLSKQMRYASRKGIQYVWFPPFDEEGIHEVKDMATGDQAPADPAAWGKSINPA
ncbi:histidine--tRNA ligase [Streptomyces beijiangensis]|uniref:Histidine--tRNA ligase n=1 Tax=Streptomyces beijiangensis TaxID=163361 RepID=A0A939F6T3_9ACTN|nr:histidine--tRNA ligase [Streptomyces beijiangensis]MBO0512983.1 histidine--tRNA ligase [Streptomyces beijiangensis]